jgi:aminopeptidase N
MASHPPDRLTRDEARRRAEQVSNVSYRIDLDLEAGAKAFRGDVTVEFDHHGGDTFLEFLGGQIDRMEVNGSDVEPEWDGARIAVPGSILGDHNEVRIVYERPFDHTGEGFHQFTDPTDGGEYLYTQFEPYSAHRVFPCFDQPDLKAPYDVSVTAPSDWTVVSAGREIDSEDGSDGRTRRVFARTAPFSTYLMSICAGPYQGVQDSHGDIPLGLYTRRSLFPHLDAEPLFEITKQGMDFYADLFDEAYPFDKYDQLFVPEFNWGGMENVGAVTYTDTVIFRDPPTRDQLVRRAEYFMHELAHMWFGDLVTLEWWDDLWLNESFASYVAYLGMDSIGGYDDIWQDFHLRMKVWAYREDQLPTTHRIADEIPSTDETFLNFDGITYGKGAATLKQLVRAIGHDAFRTGLQAYFRRHRFGNATLADFLSALQEGSGVDLVDWAARWLKTPSLNTLSAGWGTRDDRVTGLMLTQAAPDDHPVLRPHHLDVALLEPSGRLTSVPAAIEESTADVLEAEGLPVPALVYPNHEDHAYAMISLDPSSVEWARANIARIGEPLLRQQVWATVWEMVRDADIPSTDYLAMVRAALPSERSLPILQLATGTVAGAVARYVPEDAIDEEASRFFSAGIEAIETVPPGDLRVLWARSAVGMAVTPDDVLAAAALLDDPPEGLSVDQEMRWAVAVRMAALGMDEADARLSAERERDPSDRGDRAMATAAASRPTEAAKEDAWERLHSSGYPSLALAMAAARGFFVRHQRDLVEPYVGRFFDGLPAVFADWEAEAAKAYFRALFPWHRIEEDTREAVQRVIGVADGPMLRRLLVETDDDLRRALKCREVVAGTLATA